MFKNLLTMIVILFLFLTTTSFSNEINDNFKVEINSKDAIKFVVDAEVGPISLSIVGEGADLVGSVEVKKDIINGQFKVDLSQFKTGLSARDEHLMKSFEIKKYKYAHLKLIDVKIKEGEYPFKGLMNLHGIEKEVSGIINQKGKLVKAKFIINRKDFGIEIPPTIMTKIGASVDEKIQVDVKFNY